MNECDNWLGKHRPQPSHCTSVSAGSSVAVSGSVAFCFRLICCLVLRGWAFRGAGGLLEGNSFVKESSVLRLVAKDWALRKINSVLDNEKGSYREQCFFECKAEG